MYKKGSVFMTILFIALTLAVIFLVTTQNRVMNDASKQVSLKSDKVTYSYSEEMTAYATQAMANSARDAALENAKEGFGQVMMSCYSNISLLDFDKVRSDLEERALQRTAEYLSKGSDVVGDNSVLQDFVNSGEFDLDSEHWKVDIGEYDCGIEVNFVPAEKSTGGNDNIETTNDLNPQPKAIDNICWGALYRTMDKFSRENGLSKKICESMRKVFITEKNGGKVHCPSLSRDLVNQYIEDTKQTLDTIKNSINKDLKCDVEVLCNFVDPMGCDVAQSECLPDNPDLTCSVCDCCPSSDPNVPCECNGCTCGPDCPKQEDVKCTGLTTNGEQKDIIDNECEISTAEPTKSTDPTVCPDGADIVKQECDLSKAPKSIKGNGTAFKSYNVKFPSNSKAGRCESYWSDEGEVVLLLKWTCEDPVNCQNTEGTDENEPCKYLKTEMYQHIYLHQDAAPPGLPPKCEMPNCKCACACFTKGTPITMADRTTRPIETIKVGDVVLGYDIKNKKFVQEKVLELEAPVADGYYEVDYGQDILSVTADHPIFTKQKGWAAIIPNKNVANVDVTRLEVGDEVFVEGIWKTIKNIRYIDGKIQTYNLRKVTGQNNFFAQGVLVHNKGAPGGGPVQTSGGAISVVSP